MVPPLSVSVFTLRRFGPLLLLPELSSQLAVMTTPFYERRVDRMTGAGHLDKLRQLPSFAVIVVAVTVVLTTVFIWLLFRSVRAAKARIGPPARTSEFSDALLTTMGLRPNDRVGRRSSTGSGQSTGSDVSHRDTQDGCDDQRTD